MAATALKTGGQFSATGGPPSNGWSQNAVAMGNRFSVQAVGIAEVTTAPVGAPIPCLRACVPVGDVPAPS